MPCLIEQVCVAIERDRGARVPEDPTHLRHIEAQVDDQMAGEGVAQVVHPQRR